MPRPSANDEEAATEHMNAINRLSQKVAAVLFLEDLCNEGETTFMQVNSKGAILPPKDVDPNSTNQAKLAMEAARDNAEVSPSGPPLPPPLFLPNPPDPRSLCFFSPSKPIALAFWPSEAVLRREQSSLKMVHFPQCRLAR